MAKFACKTPISAAALVAALPGRAKIVGDAGRMIFRIAALDSVAPNSLSFSKAPLPAIPDDWSTTADLVVIVPPGGVGPKSLATRKVTLIEVDEPRAYFIRAVGLLLGGDPLPPAGRHPTASVAESASIGVDVYLGAGVTVGAHSIIGDGCSLFGGVQIYENVEIGAGSAIHANAAIGCWGQAYVRDEDGTMLQMPHLGRVAIGERTRIGAGAAIVRGTLSDTLIGSDTSVGNLVNIGHNVKVGNRCFIGAGAVLSGSSSIGDDTWISIAAVVRGVSVGKNVTIGVGAIVTRPVGDAQTVNGFPARVTSKDA
jgi:UDP-3-O-[3-hydroxymyristoyl] glucosamine N-acyltransferase